MRCPYCNNIDTRVVDTRTQDDNTTVRRRRSCDKCEKRFITYEKIEMTLVAVIKKNGTRELFDKNKLLGGIVKSCNKRPISMGTMEQIVNEIENNIMNASEKEIESQVIGEMVMDRLKKCDEVAYVRFASVYRRFRDIHTFMEELSKLLEEKRGN